MDRDIESEYERHREDGAQATLDQIMARHSEDMTGRCEICGTLWPCLVWVTAREWWDENA